MEKSEELYKRNKNEDPEFEVENEEEENGENR